MIVSIEVLFEKGLHEQYTKIIFKAISKTPMKKQYWKAWMPFHGWKVKLKKKHLI